jgi:ferredoxin
VDLGRKPSHLVFDGHAGLASALGTIIEIPIPFLLDVSRLEVTQAQLEGIAGAAAELRTLLVLPKDAVLRLKDGTASSMIVPVIGNADELDVLAPQVRMVEMDMSSGWRSMLEAVRRRRPEMLVSVRMRPSSELLPLAEEVAKAADVIHILFEEDGMDASGEYARDVLRRLHRHLVKAGSRDSMTIISSGGLAAAEMVPKSIICGADAVTLETAMLVALGCHACQECKGECPSDIIEAPSDFARQRIVNMGSAWRDQMLEMLGAMGIKEVRRLRGETGRAIFEEDAHRDAFAGIQGGGIIE